MPAINKSPFVPKTRAQKEIVRAVEAHGWRVVYLTWEPIGPAAPKEGASGGWSGEMVCASTVISPNTGIVETPHCLEMIYGYNWLDVLSVVEETIDGTQHARWRTDMATIARSRLTPGGEGPNRKTKPSAASQDREDSMRDIATLAQAWTEERDERHGFAEENERQIEVWGGTSSLEYDAGYQRAYADALTRVLRDLGLESEAPDA